MGPALTVKALAQAFQQAGAYDAMQLDINGFYTRFALYAPTSGNAKYPVMATKLLSQMVIPQALFLTAYDRDFFYMTTR